MTKPLPVLVWIACLLLIASAAYAQTPVISGTLSVSLTGDNNSNGQVNPGDQLSYSLVITNSGSGSATGVNLTMPAPANTTLVTGSLKTSTLARPDAYTTLISGTLSGSSVLTNDFGLPTKTVAAFGPSASPTSVVANGSNSAPTDAGGTVVMNPDGTFSYTPSGSFVGYDKFGYTATTTTLPNDAATVTVGVGTPITAQPNAYSITGNVTNTQAAPGLLGNDTGDQKVVTAVNGNTANVGVGVSTAQSGTVTVQSNGSFVYEPRAGYTGPDSFTYTANNGLNLPSSAVVSLSVQDMIWFVKSGAPAGGTGTLAKPFNSVGAFQAINIGAGGTTNGDPGDAIFVYSGTYTESVVLTLLASQKLIGQGATASLASLAGITLAPGSGPLPTTSGTPPVLNTTASSVVQLGSGNLLRGLALGTSSVVTLTGSSFTSLTVSETSINNTVSALALTNGAVNGSFSSISSSGGTNNISLNNLTGSFSISGGTLSGAGGSSFSVNGGSVSVTTDGTITQASGGVLVNIVGGHTGTLNFNGALHASTGTGLQFDNADGMYTFNGTTTLSGGDAGIDIVNGSTGSFTFAASTTITNPSGTGFNINGSNANVTYSGSISDNSGYAVNIDNHDSGTITFQTGSISSTGTGLRVLNSGGGSVNFNSPTKSLSTGSNPAIDLSVNNTGGTVNFGGGGLVITTTSGTGFLATGGGTVTVTKDAGTNNTITKSGNGNALNISSTNAGANGINFNSINVTGGTGTAVTISSSTGVKSLGDVDVARSGGGTGIFASNAGTVNTSDGTIISGNQIAVDIDNTALGIALLSVSSNGSTTGIDLNTTTGSFAVNGTGTTNGSGGTIQNIVNRGVTFQSATNITLKNMQFINANTADASLATCGAANNLGCNAAIYLNMVTNVTLNNVDISGTTTQQGINAREVSGLQLLNSTIANAGTGGQSEEGGLYALNLSGTTTIASTSITFPGGRGVTIYNTSKTLSLSVAGSTFSDTQSSGVGADGFEMSAFGTSNTTLTIVNSSFLRNSTNGIQFIGSGNSVSTVNITGSTLDYGSSPVGGGALDLDADTNGSIQFNFNNNTCKGAETSIVNFYADGNSSLEGRCNSNTVTSGGGSGTGIRVLEQGTSKIIIEIKANRISGITLDNGIDVISRAGNYIIVAATLRARLDAIIDGNIVTVGSGANANIRAAAGQSGSMNTSKTCAWVKNNNTTGGAGFSNFEGRVVNAHELILQGGGANISANWNSNSNTPASPPAIITPSISGAGTITLSGTCQVPTNPLP